MQTIEEHLLQQGFELLKTHDELVTYAQHPAAGTLTGLPHQPGAMITLNAKALKVNTENLSLSGANLLIVKDTEKITGITLKRSTLILQDVGDTYFISLRDSKVTILESTVEHLNCDIRDSRLCIEHLNGQPKQSLVIHDSTLEPISINAARNVLTILRGRYDGAYSENGELIIEHNAFDLDLENSIDGTYRWVKGSLKTSITNAAGVLIDCYSFLDKTNQPAIVAGCWESSMDDFIEMVSGPFENWPSYKDLPEDELLEIPKKRFKKARKLYLNFAQQALSHLAVNKS